MTDMKYVRLFARPNGETNLEDVAVEFHLVGGERSTAPLGVEAPRFVVLRLAIS
jgi:hypothetical protein